MSPAALSLSLVPILARPDKETDGQVLWRSHQGDLPQRLRRGEASPTCSTACSRRSSLTTTHPKRTTMSDEGDRACPLCAKEMDLADQQLKPCKCGYKICVWCWHHIIEMAEKDGSEGRCPACRTQYDKERIVRMSAKCERVVAASAEKKQRPQRAKTKASSEVRKHLEGVRVIKRNLVYAVGLPSNLADESILERREYFGQYGKVLKVSISRPTSAAAAIQQAANTFSVYITYAREEEAIRCIQAVHNFVLEGKPLKACFGTTKYCHIWLRNMICTNPDCLYLHDVGSQEDSFTKDEIISAYTRSRVPQSSNNLQRQSGHILPPPLDDLCSNEVVSGKNMIKSVSNNTAGQIRGSTNISNGGRSAVLPAAASWGSRVSNCRPSDTSTTSSQNSVKQKEESPNSSSSLLSVVAGTKQVSLHGDAVIPSKIYEGSHTLHTNHRDRSSEPFKSGSGKDVRVTASDVPPIARTLGVSAWDDGDTVSSIPQEMCVKGRLRDVETLKPGLGNDTLTSPGVSTGNTTLGSLRSAWDDDEITPELSVGEETLHASEAMVPNIDKEYLSPILDMPLKAVIGASNTSRAFINTSSPVASSPKELKSITSLGENSRLLNTISSDGSDRKSSSSDRVFARTTDCENVESICSGLASANVDSHLGVDHLFMEQHQRSDLNHFSNDMHIASGFQQYHTEHGAKSEVSASSGKISVNPGTYAPKGLFDRNSMLALVSRGSVKEETAAPDDESLIERLPHSINQLLGVADEHLPANFSHQPIDTFENNGANTALLLNEVSQTVDSHRENGSVSVREDTFSGSVKSDILCSSANEREANFLGRLNDLPSTVETPSAQMQEDSIITDIISLDFDPWDDSSSSNNLSNLLGQINGQNGISSLPNLWKSKPTNQSRFSFARVENHKNGSDTSGDAHNQSSSPQDMDENGLQYDCRFSSLDGLNGIANNKPAYSSDSPGFARGKVSTPPGFQVPFVAPPPGFSSHDRFCLPYETHPETHLGGNSSFPTQYHAAENANDMELVDPAIMAVGKGIMPLGSNNSILGARSAFPPQFGMDGDTGLHLLKQQSVHQNLRIPEQIGDKFSPMNDAYISPRLLEQNHSSQSPLLPMPYQQPIASHVLGSQWGWNDMPTHNTMGMNEILRNERFGVDSYYPVHDEHAFHRMSSSNLYNRAFGM